MNWKIIRNRLRISAALLMLCYFEMLLLGHYHWNYLYLATLIAVFAQFGMILYDTTTTSSSL